MTDRHVGYTVVLGKEIRDDDAVPILTAIRQIRGVLKVTPQVASPEFYMAREQARGDLKKTLWAALLKDP